MAIVEYGVEERWPPLENNNNNIRPGDKHGPKGDIVFWDPFIDIRSRIRQFLDKLNKKRRSGKEDG